MKSPSGFKTGLKKLASIEFSCTLNLYVIVINDIALGLMLRVWWVCVELEIR